MQLSEKTSDSRAPEMTRSSPCLIMVEGSRLWVFMKEIRCYNCNQAGYFVKACPARPGNISQGRERGTRAWSRNRQDRKKHKGRWSKRDWHNNQSDAQNQTPSWNWNQGQLGGMPTLSKPQLKENEKEGSRMDRPESARWDKQRIVANVDTSREYEGCFCGKSDAWTVLKRKGN